MAMTGWTHAKRGGAREVTRQQILDAALRLFTNSGHIGVRVEDIAREAGVSRATFYKHFAERDEILTELFSRLLDDADDNPDGTFDEAAGAVETVDIETCVRELLAKTINHMLENDQLARFVYSLPVRHDAVLPGGVGEPAVFRAVRLAFRQALDAGEVRDGLNVDRVLEILGDVFESAMRDWAVGSVEDPVERLGELLDVVFGGITAPR